MKNQFKSLIISIINQRKKLMKMNLSGKSSTLCAKYITNISRYVEAYQDKWDENGWRNFIKRHQEEIEYLIPENKAGETIKKKLYAI